MSIVLRLLRPGGRHTFCSMHRLARFRRSLYRVAIILAGLTFVLGVWRVFVRHDRQPGPFWQLLFPLLVLRLALTLYRRTGRV
jgi:hypothetical protein